MITIVADNNIPFLPGALDNVARMIYLPASEINRKGIKGADALIIRTRTICDEKLLKGTPVKFIASATIGSDHIDAEFCAANRIAWTNAPGCNSASVEQYVASALAEIIRIEKKPFSDISLGIIGAGNVGSKVASMARYLGMKTLVNDPPRERVEGAGHFVSLGRLLAESDVVTIHVPLTRTGPDVTFHLSDREFFKKMKKGSWFINTSRGEVVDSKSLIEAVKSHQLAGVVLDVWENEPDIDRELLRLAHLSTPHIAGYSADGKANGTAMSVRSISHFFDLGLKNWYPEDIPAPAATKIQLSCQNKPIEEVFCEISRFAYDIMKDSVRLKIFPGEFEIQRENYPVRREPGFYHVGIMGDCREATQLMRNLGYQTS
jgi:erythronate-4-phosphate dehydrogenase